MTIWYVQPDTGGSGAGTTGDPWDGFADITWGVGGVVAGDTLILNAGTYSEMLTIGASGTLGSAITITFLAGAVIDGSGVNYGISMTDRDYITINDPVCHSATFSGINGLATCIGVTINAPTCYSNSANGIRFRDSQDVVVNNPTCYSNTLDGVLFDTTATGSPSGNQVVGGTIYSNGSEGVMVAGHEATPVEQENARIYAVTSYSNGAGFYTQISNNVLIENCVAYDNTGAIAAGNERYGIALYKSTNGTIKRNTVYGNSNHGIELNDACGGTAVSGNRSTAVAAGKYAISTQAATGTAYTLSGNVVVSNGSGNVGVYCGASPTASFCCNNTIETTTGLSCIRIGPSAAGWTLKNNIFTGLGLTTADSGVNVEIERSCYFNTGVLATYNGTDYTVADISTLDAAPVAEDPELNARDVPGNTKLYTRGAKWWTGDAPIGADGEAFWDKFPSIGAIQAYVNPRQGGGRVLQNNQWPSGWQPTKEEEKSKKGAISKKSSKERLAELMGKSFSTMRK